MHKCNPIFDAQCTVHSAKCTDRHKARRTVEAAPATVSGRFNQYLARGSGAPPQRHFAHSRPVAREQLAGCELGRAVLSCTDLAELCRASRARRLAARPKVCRWATFLQRRGVEAAACHLPLAPSSSAQLAGAWLARSQVSFSLLV